MQLPYNDFGTWIRRRFGSKIQKISVNACGYYEKRWGGGTFTKSGLPDMHICVNGRSLELEIKAQNGHPSELQKKMVGQINTSGGAAAIIYPDDFNYVKAVIRHMKTLEPDWLLSGGGFI